jgi:hypothetical protein
MGRRDIPAQTVESILNNPEQIVLDASGKRVYQSKVDFGSGKAYLVRVVVNEQGDVPLVVTAYRTSRIDIGGHHEDSLRPGSGRLDHSV